MLDPEEHDQYETGDMADIARDMRWDILQAIVHEGEVIHVEG